MLDTKYGCRYRYVHRFPYGKTRTGKNFVSLIKIELSLTKGSLYPKYKILKIQKRKTRNILVITLVCLVFRDTLY